MPPKPAQTPFTMSRTLPTFKKGREEAFYLLKQFATQLEQVNGPKADRIMLSKAILFPSLYIGTYLAALLWGHNILVLYGTYMLLGALLVFIFLNLIHDAVHQSLFRSRWANRLYVYFFDLMGANSYVWSIRHRKLHHNYPNIMGWDSDIEQSDIARVFPHGEFSKAHKNQHLYLPFLYPLYLFNWLLIRDFKDFFNQQKPVWKVTDIPRIEYVKLFFFKALFLFNMIILPKWLLGLSWWTILGAFVVMLLTASVFSLMVLLSPHANTESAFPLPDENNQIGHTWFMHQLMCTNDVMADNWFVRYFMGSFNYHLIHHLFPTLNHVHYPEVTAELRRLAAQYQLPYRAYPLWATLKNHYALLKRNGTRENIFEETM